MWWEFDSYISRSEATSSKRSVEPFFRAKESFEKPGSDSVLGRYTSANRLLASRIEKGNGQLNVARMWATLDILVSLLSVSNQLNNTPIKRFSLTVAGDYYLWKVVTVPISPSKMLLCSRTVRAPDDSRAGSWAGDKSPVNRPIFQTYVYYLLADR